jgi:Ran GTPase-activating protein (RanGAP) involved in mRNA processing and transport
MMINIMSKNTDKNIKFGDDKKNNLSELISDQFTGYSIDLSNLGALSSEDFQKVIDALKKNTTITTLYLSGNNIGDKGAEKLAKALEKNTTITKLSLRSNNIGKAGAEVLAQALKENKTLTELDLGWNNIGDEGAEKLAEALKNNETLTTLDLSVNNIGEVGAKALAEALKENKTLTELDLSWNKIGDDGAKAIAEALKENETITTLYLSVNNIGKDGAEKLAEALKENKTITTLYLSSNNIREAGAKKLAEALKENKTLTELNLSDNKITISQIIALGEVCANRKDNQSNLIATNIEFGNYKKNNLFTLISGQFTGYYIDLSDLSLGALSPEYFQKVIKAIKKNTTIKELDLRWNSITSSQIIALGEACANRKDNQGKTIATNIEFDDDKKNDLFKLISGQFTGDSIDLSRLSLGALSSEDSKKVIKALEKNKTITTLYLGNSNLTNEQIIALGEACANRKDDQDKTIATNIKFTYSQENDLFKLISGQFTGDSINLSDLSLGALSSEDSKKVIKALKENTTITKLGLSFNKIEKDGVIALAEALKENKTLTELNFGWNSIGKDGVIALAQALKKNETITTLDLSGNKIGKDGVIALAQALKKNETITNLNLKNNDITNEQVIALGIACEGKNITVDFGDDEENNLFKLAQKYGNKKAESSYSFNIPAAATEIFTASTIIALLTIITLSILASQGIIAFDSAAFIAPVASVGAINLVTFIGFAITEVTSKVMDYKNVSEYNQFHESDKGFKPQKVHWLNPCHKVQFVDRVLSKENEQQHVI